MKKILISILFCFPLFVHALITTYYFSSVGNDATGNGTIGNPYQTIAKANSIAYATGSILSFNGLHGLPAQTIHDGISLTTTDLAPTTAPSCIVTPG